MMRQQPGDFLEIQFDGKYYYVVVLTKVVMLGGNIIFAFHGDGSRQNAQVLLEQGPGFNICTDLLLPKREGVITRISRLSDLTKFWPTRLSKGTNEYRRGYKAAEWYIYSVDDLQNHIERTKLMTSEYAAAMDHAVSSFDLVASKMLNGYTPDQNPFLSGEVPD